MTCTLDAATLQNHAHVPARLSPSHMTAVRTHSVTAGVFGLLLSPDHAA